MEKRTFRGNAGRKGLNQVFLVGEVIDMGIIPQTRGVNVRARLKIRCPSKKSAFVYLDVYGKRSCSEVMTLVCQTGNIVYVEGEFRNLSQERLNVTPYVLVTHITCLLRRRDVAPPSTSIIRVLDELDPIGYASHTNPRKKKNSIKEEKHTKKEEQ